MSIAETWGSTPEERALQFACDNLIPDADAVYFRAIDVNAPAPVVFRWLCQLRVAPYSYDWIDNGGQRSPRQLTPGSDRLETGQRVMRIFRLTAFEQDRHITVAIDPHRPTTLFGEVAVTYAVRPGRLVVKVKVRYNR